MTYNDIKIRHLALGRAGQFSYLKVARIRLVI